MINNLGFEWHVTRSNPDYTGPERVLRTFRTREQADSYLADLTRALGRTARTTLQVRHRDEVTTKDRAEAPDIDPEPTLPLVFSNRLELAMADDEPVDGQVYVEQSEAGVSVVLHEGLGLHGDVVGDGLGRDPDDGGWSPSFPGHVAAAVNERLPIGFSATAQWSPVEDGFTPAVEIRVTHTAPVSGSDIELVQAMAPAIATLETIIDPHQPSYLFASLPTAQVRSEFEAINVPMKRVQPREVPGAVSTRRLLTP